MDCTANTSVYVQRMCESTHSAYGLCDDVDVDGGGTVPHM